MKVDPDFFRRASTPEEWFSFFAGFSSGVVMTLISGLIIAVILK